MRELEDRKEGEQLDSDSSKRKLEENIQLAKLKAQEIVAKLVSNAEAKRPRLDTDFPVPVPAPAPAVSNFSTGGSPFTGQYHGFQNTSKKISIPNVKVGLIIGKGGETIKYIQLQSGAKIQITRDTEADRHSLTRDVELMGTEEQISRGEELINEVIAEKDAEVPASAANHGINSNQPTEQDIVKIPNNKVALLIGKGGETIKNIQTKSGARVQVIPLHLPPGDTSTERNVYINGPKEQIESAKELINEVISGKGLMNSTGTNSYGQSAYPTGNWSQTQQSPSGVHQHPQYGYSQPSSYFTPHAPSPYYGTYPTEAANWDQSNQSALSQPSQSSAAYNYSVQDTQVQAGFAQNPNYSYSQTLPVGNQNYYYGSFQQPPNPGPHMQTQTSSYDQQAFYANSEYGPPGVAFDSDAQRTSSQSNLPSTYSQPMADPQAGYWSYPSNAAESFAQASYDQSNYYQTAYEGQQPVQAPTPLPEQTAYPQPPNAQGNSRYSHEEFQDLKQAQTEPATEEFLKPQLDSVEKTGEENSAADRSVPAVQESVNSQS